MSIDDERVRFYLRHRDQIEEWAKLRDQAALAIDEWLLALEPEIEKLAEQLGPDVILKKSLDPSNPWPAFRLVRSTWPDAQTGMLPVSIGLEWARGRTNLRPPSTPYVGVRCPKTDDLGQPLRSSDALRAARQQRKHQTSAWWPAYGTVIPADDFPDRAGDYQQSLIDALRDSWVGYSEIVTQVISTR